MVTRAYSQMDLEAATSSGGLHRRDGPAQQRSVGGAGSSSGGSSGGSAGGGGSPRKHIGRQAYDRLGKARGLLPGWMSARWKLLALVLAGLLLHSMTAHRAHPMIGRPRGGSLAGGIDVRSIATVDGGYARPRALVEQPQQQSTLTAALAAAADLVSSRPREPEAAAPAPPSPVPEVWLEGGTLGMWPKPYRNKTRQVMPNSIYKWKCSQEASNFTLATTFHTTLLQSTEWRQRYGDNVSIYKWCREGLPEEVPQLQQVLKLESKKPRPERGLTVVTQLSLERFQMLENQCRVWPYQISAVLYIPLLKGRIFSAEEPVWNKKSLDVGVAEALKFFNSMEESPTSCILDLEVVVEERCERYAAMLYPANAARNRALVNAKTEAMLLVDVDFAVSLSLAEIVEKEESYQELMDLLHQRNAVVLPAFETMDDGEAGKKVALEAVRMGKPYVTHKFEWNVVFGFHVPQYPQGHQATDYWRWIKTNKSYPVQYQVGYEPYILMHRNYVPFYDERFRGYYWNKVEHLMHISLQNGFNFVVHPTAFVVHVPHKKPSTKWLTRKMGQKEKNHMLFDNSLFHMRQMDFVPVTSFPELCSPEVAPVLHGEMEAREIAAQKAAVEKAAAEQAAAAAQHQQALAAAAAKRAAEAEEAAQWRAENVEDKAEEEEAGAAPQQAAAAAQNEQPEGAAASGQQQHSQQQEASAGTRTEQHPQQASGAGAHPQQHPQQQQAAGAGAHPQQQQAGAGAHPQQQQAGAGAHPQQQQAGAAAHAQQQQQAGAAAHAQQQQQAGAAAHAQQQQQAGAAAHAQQQASATAAQQQYAADDQQEEAPAVDVAEQEEEEEDIEEAGPAAAAAKGQQAEEAAGAAAGEGSDSKDGAAGKAASAAVQESDDDVLVGEVVGGGHAGASAAVDQLDRPADEGNGKPATAAGAATGDDEEELEEEAEEEGELAGEADVELEKGGEERASHSQDAQPGEGKSSTAAGEGSDASVGQHQQKQQPVQLSGGAAAAGRAAGAQQQRRQ